jgi:DNA-binding transcriptional LysR family regulator
MTFRQLELLASVAKHRSITQTAREFRVSQPAVSQQLKRLQDELGAILVKKNGKGIEITENGFSADKEGRLILSLVDGLKKKFLKSPESTTAASLTLAGGHVLSTSLLPALLARFSKTHPAAKLTLRTGNSREIEELILASKVDLAVITRPTFSTFLQTEPFRAETLTAFVSHRHPLAKRKTIEASDLPRVSLVVRVGRQGETPMEDRFRSLGPKGSNLKIAMRCESPESLKEAVRNGVGVGVLPHEIIKRELARGEFKTVRLAGIDLTGQNYIVYSKERPLSKPAQDFLALLRAERLRTPRVKRATSGHGKTKIGNFP